MKHNKNHDNAKSGGFPLQPVHFEFTDPAARTVCIAGTFDDWRPDAKPMHHLGGGRWVKETVLPPGDYGYCLVVDGKWMPDPLAKETVPNPFGGSKLGFEGGKPSSSIPLARLNQQRVVAE